MKKKLITVMLLGCLLPGLSRAAGFALIELSGSGQGNAFAGAAASASDASTIFFNPAGMMLLDGDQMAFAGHLIMPQADFTNQGSSAAAILGGAPLTGEEDDGGYNAIVPNFYWVREIDASMKFGLGVNAPFGLATKYDDDWVGRYHGVVSDLQTIDINPSLAYRVNEQLSIGGGVNVLLADVNLSSAVDFGAVCVASLGPATCAGLGSLPQQNDGFVEFKADNFDDLGLGFNLGLMYEISRATRVGFSYRSEIKIKASGDADFRVPSNMAFLMSSGLFLDSGISADVNLPQILSLSIAHQSGKITYLADVTWTGWSSFDELRIVYDNTAQPDSVTTEEWQDSLRYSFGIDYQYSDRMVLRTGIALDETPVPSAERRTPRLPGNDRTWLSFGMTYRYSDQMTFDVGYSHLFVDNAKIDNTFESSVPTLAATLSGEYEASVDILSAQLNWKY